MQYVHVNSSSNAAVIRNAGVHSSESAYVLMVDAGDRLDPACIACIHDAIAADPAIDLLTTHLFLRGPSESKIVTCDVANLVGDVDAVHAASVFSRRVWSAIGGFDANLEALENYDFWLRALRTGAEAMTVARPLFVVTMESDALYRHAWSDPGFTASINSVIQKNVATFAHSAPTALFGREQTLNALSDDFRALLQERDAALQELQMLQQRADRLRTLYPAYTQEDGAAHSLRSRPLSRNWGFDRGTPVDRVYIERFLASHAADIRGAVLEIADDTYAQRFGGSAVDCIDVVDIDASNARATVISDLRNAANLPSDRYDCLIVTQTLHVISDLTAVVAECARLLRPSGVLLATLPCASRLATEYGPEGDFWRATPAGARELFAPYFPEPDLQIRAYGNLQTTSGFLYGLAAHELPPESFDAIDPAYPLIVGIRATRQPLDGTAVVSPRRRTNAAAVLMYHRLTPVPSDIHGLSVPEEEFEAHIAHIASNYHALSLHDVIAAAHDDVLPARAVAITFDDGYLDNYTRAAPILSRYAVPATFFVTAKDLASDFEFWWDTLERLLLWPESPLPDTIDVRLPEKHCVFRTSTPDERLDVYWSVYRQIVDASAQLQERVLEDLKSALRYDMPVALRRMKTSELSALASQRGMTIGAHSLQHLRLTMHSASDVWREVNDSFKVLDGVLNQQTSCFSYPFGAFDDTVLSIVSKRATLAVTTTEQVVSASTQSLRVPRFKVDPSRSKGFERWLSEVFHRTSTVLSAG